MNSTNLLGALRAREIGRKSNEALLSGIDSRIKKNLLNDISTYCQLDVKSDVYTPSQLKHMQCNPIIWRLRRCQNFIATTLRFERIILYDLALKRMMWTYTLPETDRNILKLKVSKDGVVTATTQPGGQNILRIFVQGRMTGTIDLTNQGWRFQYRVIHNKIYGTYLYRTLQKVDQCAAYIWNLKGTLIQKIPKGNFEGEIDFTVYNDNFYAVVGSTRRHGVDVQVVDCATGRHQTYKVEEGGQNFSLLRKGYIHKNTIFLAGNDKIIILDALSGKIINKFAVEGKGEMQKLIVSDDFIVYIINNDSKFADIYSINRHSGKQNRFGPIPICFKSPKIRISLLDQLLTVFYSDGRLDWGDASQKLLVIELNEPKILKHTTYNRYSEHGMSIEAGKLVIPNFYNCSVYVQDFTFCGVVSILEGANL